MKKLTKILVLAVVLVLSLVFATACETLDNHTHAPATQWVSDCTNHWHPCTFDGCTQKYNQAACSGGNATYDAKAICSVCGNEYGEFAEDNRPLLKSTHTSQLLKLASWQFKLAKLAQQPSTQSLAQLSK